MRQRIAPFQRGNARRMRRDGTDAEQRLWSRLRNAQLDGMKFRRQVPIGRFIVDFACFDAGLIVEVDGSQHAANASDKSRDAELNARGFRVLRFWNHDVLASTDDVLATILAASRDRDPLTPPT